MNFTLAHFSDLHLGPLPAGAAFVQFRAKRLMGALSWHLNRKKHHLPEIAEALRADILQARPDHIAFTGDGVNIASPREFPPLLQWVQATVAPDRLSFTPGNHDAYVKVDWDKSLGLLQPYMQGDKRGETGFPYVRLRRNVALIGLNSALPRGFHSAQGLLGKSQLAALRDKLLEFKAKGFYRLVMIHHPPLSGTTKTLRSLIDAADFSALLQEVGAELVIHGHNHKRQINRLPHGEHTIPVIGVASASMAGSAHPAEWHHYAITRQNGRWQTELSIRQWHDQSRSFQPLGAMILGDAA